MKILNVHLENFASYKELDFKFDDKGLVLIHGATGSGKSTLCDAIPWILFGITAKNGKADDVLSWNGGTTYGTASINIKDQTLIVARTRKPNDLYYAWEHVNAGPQRGKDLQDTQKLINQLLGMDSDLYLAGAYFHEFSQTAQFFTTLAKSRREITENLVDLSLPNTLQEKIKEQTKVNTIELNTLSNNIFTLTAKLDILKESAKEAKNSNAIWAHEQANRISTIEMKLDMFDVTRTHKVKSIEKELSLIKIENPINYEAELNKLQLSLPTENEPCTICGSPKSNPKRQEILQCINEVKEQKRINSDNLRRHGDLTKQINELKDQENPYAEQLIEVKAQTNPHSNALVKLEKELNKYNDLLKAAMISEQELKDSRLNLGLLSDAVTSFRAELIHNTVEDLEARTKSHLRDFFEGEISVEFTIQENDKLEVIITKDGNVCNYTQLSKGQRQMLRLCFGISVIECIQQHHVLEFKQLFFDESLDGMDDTNKLRAVKMLETLASHRDSVYIVEHSEGVKAHIDQKYFVDLVDGKSTICQA